MRRGLFGMVACLLLLSPALSTGGTDSSVSPVGSVSCGAANKGALANAVKLEPVGLGYTIPEPWRSRGLHYGTEQLVGLITRAAAAVALEYPGAQLGVADLSLARGGSVERHRSHQSGRDVDLLFYALDGDNQPMAPDQVMPVYTSSGRAYYAKAPTWQRHIAVRYFDLERNWALVKALATDPEANVTHIFVSRRIRRWLLDYGDAAGESAETLARLSEILKRPGSGGHNDHMHVRIACSAADHAWGRCRDETVPRRRRGRWRVKVRCPRPVE